MASGTTSGGSGSILNDAGIIAAAAFAALGTLALGAPIGVGLFVGGIAIAVGFLAAATIAKGNELSPDMVVSDLDLNSCFARGTLIQLPNGSKPIEDIVPGDVVMAFDKFGALTPLKVVRLFRNVTDRWLELSFETNDRAPLIVTPGHRFLAANGSFETIERLLDRGSGRTTIVLADGSLASVRGKLIAFSEQTAHFFEQGSILDRDSVGALALAAHERRGWATYNFEVEDLHTYVAGGVRVHNDSDGADS